MIIYAYSLVIDILRTQTCAYAWITLQIAPFFISSKKEDMYEKIWRIKTGQSCANKWNPAYRKFYLLNIRPEILGWMYIHIDRIWHWITYKGWYAIK